MHFGRTVYSCSYDESWNWEPSDYVSSLGIGRKVTNDDGSKTIWGHSELLDIPGVLEFLYSIPKYRIILEDEFQILLDMHK